MRDSDLLTHWRKHLDAPGADNTAVLEEMESRFLREPWAGRKVFVDSLEQDTQADEISIRERAERLSIARRFRRIHEGLKKVGR
jgi:hypothetical protein